MQRLQNAARVPTPTALGGNDFYKMQEVFVLYLESAEAGPQPRLFLDCFTCLIIYCVFFYPPYWLAKQFVVTKTTTSIPYTVVKKYAGREGVLGEVLVQA